MITPEVDRFSPVTPDFDDQSTRTPPDAKRNLPAWPVLALLWGMPAWWAFGLLPFCTIIMAVPMVAFLIQRRPITLTPGVLPWLAFVVWMIPCALMLDSVGRMIGYSVRLGQFASVAIALVYLVNARRTLTVERVLGGLTFTWLFVIVGGYLGMLWPDVTLTFTIGRLLPQSILDNSYVSDLVFPPLAEVQTPYGAEEPFLRPSAPFAYTNGWGAAIAILTPIAIATAITRRTARAMVLVMIAIAFAIPPAIASTNRGLFIGLIVAVVYVLIRLLLRGKFLPFLWVALLGTLLATVLALSGLLEDIATRQETSDTSEGRSLLYMETFTRSLSSPVLGYGAPRPSFTSEIAVGTQGHLWNMLFCFGFVGVGLFLLFIVGGLVRTAGTPNVATIWLHAAVVTGLTLSAFYGLDRHLLALCLVLGIMLRERYADSSSFWSRTPRASQ